jgi:hypothetical protein
MFNVTGLPTTEKFHSIRTYALARSLSLPNKFRVFRTLNKGFQRINV